MRNHWGANTRSPHHPKAHPNSAPAHDPVDFARLVGFNPDDKQAEVLRAMANPAVKQGILNCTRQWGKSTTVAAGAVHRLVTRPGSLVVVASPSEKQSAEIVRTVKGMLAQRGLKTKPDGVQPVSGVLSNGSRIVGLPSNPKTTRGIASVSLLIVDEASQVSDSLYHALRPMVVIPRGDVWLLSTPWNAAGFFYEAWENGGPSWKRFSVRATECPRIPADWLENERSQVPDWVFRREYMTEFVQDDLAAFDTELIHAAVTDEVEAMEFDWDAFYKAQRQQQQWAPSNSIVLNGPRSR